MRPSKNILLGTFGLIAIGIALGLNRFIDHHFGQSSYTPVRTSVNMIAGYALTNDFMVERRADYEVGLECRKTLPFEQLDGILQKGLNLKYTVFEDGRVLGCIDSSNGFLGAGYADDRITRRLNSFPASPGRHYRIELNVRGSLPELSATSPTLLVELSERKADILTYPLFCLCGIFSGAVGLILFLYAGTSQLVYWLRKRKNTEPMAGSVGPTPPQT